MGPVVPSTHHPEAGPAQPGGETSWGQHKGSPHLPPCPDATLGKAEKRKDNPAEKMNSEMTASLLQRQHLIWRRQRFRSQVPVFSTAAGMREEGRAVTDTGIVCTSECVCKFTTLLHKHESGMRTQ